MVLLCIKNLEDWSENPSIEDDFKNKERHIIFLLHGFMSDADDLDKILSAIMIKSPLTSIHLIKSIETITNLGIFDLGKIIAEE